MRTENQNPHVLNAKLRDSSSKVIFDDPVLCAQFLRDYVNIPMLSGVRPEDIEDVSGRYVPLIGEERNADSIKKINIYGSTSLFLVSLIEHKTEVDYNVSMQIFRYMVYIWEDYEKEMERAYNKGITKTRDFRYPPILPIVYYEGKGEWTAPHELKDRILCHEILEPYIPNYRYHLVELRDYSNDVLLEKQDEISLIMLINKIQNRQDVEMLKGLPPEVFDGIIKDTPERILDLIAAVFRTLLIQLNVPEQETEEMVGKVKVRKMGELFANADFEDIRRDWQKVKDARRETERYKEQAECYRAQNERYKKQVEQFEQYKEQFEQYKEQSEQYQRQNEKYKAENRKIKQDLLEAKENGVRRLIARRAKEGVEASDIVSEIQDIFELTQKEAEQKIKQYWQKM